MFELVAGSLVRVEVGKDAQVRKQRASLCILLSAKEDCLCQTTPEKRTCLAADLPVDDSVADAGSRDTHIWPNR